MANFQPLPVSHYIQHCLPPTASSLSPFLSFGLASAALSSNTELAAVDEWLASVEKRNAANVAATRAAGSSAGLESVLKRLQQELRGQIDAEKLERAHEAEYEAALRADDIARILRPPLSPTKASQPGRKQHRSQSPDVQPRAAFASRSGADVDARPQSPTTEGSTDPASAPKSLPALLHTIANLAGTTFADAIANATGQTVYDLEGGGGGGGEAIADARVARARVVTAADSSTWSCTCAFSKQTGAAASEDVIRDWISRSNNLTRASASRAAYFSRRPLDASAQTSTMVAVGTLGNGRDGDDSTVMAAEFTSDSEVIVAYASAGDTSKSFTPSLAASVVWRADFNRSV